MTIEDDQRESGGRFTAGAQELGQGVGRRRALALGSAGSLAAFLAACAPGAPGASPDATGGAAGTPRRGGTAVVVTDGDPSTLNMATTTSNTPGDIGAKIFDGLVWLESRDGAFVPQPSLATSWTIAPDGRTYSFKLRPGVKWHDGRDFTSADVKFTYEEVLAKHHPRTRGTLMRLAGIDTPDPLSVTVRLTEPYAPFLLQQSVFDSPILPKHLYEGTDIVSNPYNQRPVGTGPFKFGQWSRGSNVRLTRNETYWEAGKPYLDGIVYPIVPQAANRATGLETGEIDFAVDFYLSKSDVPRLIANTKLQSKRGQGSPNIYFAMMNLRTPALAKPEARQALAFAINRETIVQQALGGFARAGNGAFGEGFKWLFNDEVSYARKYPFSVDRAKAALAAAGVTGNVTLRCVYDSARAQLIAAGQIIRDNLRQLGITVDLQPLESSVMIQKVFIEREFDLTLQSFTSSGDPAIGYHRLYVTTEGRQQYTNATSYSNPRVDELLARAGTAVTPQERAPFYKEAQAILNDDLPSLVLFEELGVDIAAKKLNGLWKSWDSRDRWGDVWLSP
ncbi:MAG: ABC transporter substrate-binding protein [Chloroflexota bacterium]|nr:ABC transporter substrate-binding protein [Chloroflexota bacterium]